MYLNQEEVYKIIISHISINKPNINRLLSVWLGEKQNYNEMNISPRELNSKFLALSKVSKYLPNLIIIIFIFSPPIPFARPISLTIIIW